MIYFTSDLHLGHDKEFIFKSRGFEDIDSHNMAIVANWNATVSEDDTIYVLGDLVLGDVEHGLELLKQLKGKIICLLGNHDNAKKAEAYAAIGIECHGYAEILKYKGYTLYLSHFPTITGNDFGPVPSIKMVIINLFGHTHQSEKFYNNMSNMYHVGVDSHGCKPVGIDEIIDACKNKFAETLNT